MARITRLEIDDSGLPAPAPEIEQEGLAIRDILAEHRPHADGGCALVAAGMRPVEHVHKRGIDPESWRMAADDRHIGGGKAEFAAARVQAFKLAGGMAQLRRVQPHGRPQVTVLFA